MSQNPKAFLVIDEIIDSTTKDILERFCLPSKNVIPLAKSPDTSGYYVTFVPFFEEEPFDGEMKLPHSAILLVVDSGDSRTLGFHRIYEEMDS